MNTSSYATKTVTIAGASGYVGSALVPLLNDLGWKVIQLVRSEPQAAEQVQWDPANGQVPDEVISGVDVVINLAGASIAGGWWTEKRKNLILKSRIDSTRTLAEAIARAGSPPKLLINVSGVGYYGDRPGELLDESAARGAGFLADVCQQWEQAADPAREAGVRVVHPRLGVVFSGDGGMLPLIKIPFNLGLGGKIGGGQYMSWIDLHDLVRMIPFIIEHEDIEGPVNAVAPGAVTNAEFTKAMGRALHRPTIVPIPKTILGKLGGGLVDELLLFDQHVAPQVLLDAGFDFERPTIDSTLERAFR